MSFNFICENGHLIKKGASTPREFAGTFCHRCGKRVIFQCENCEQNIADDTIRQERFINRESAREDLRYVVPVYCSKCSSPYPWQAAKLAAAIEYIDLLDIESSDKKELAGSLEDIASDNPRRKVGALKIQHYISKLGQETGHALRELVVDIGGKALAELIKG